MSQVAKPSEEGPPEKFVGPPQDRGAAPEERPTAWDESMGTLQKRPTAWDNSCTNVLQHFSYPRTPVPPRPRTLEKSRPRTPETAQCGLSVGNKCDWNPKMGTGNQVVMWRVRDVRVVFRW